MATYRFVPGSRDDQALLRKVLHAPEGVELAETEYDQYCTNYKIKMQRTSLVTMHTTLQCNTKNHHCRNDAQHKYLLDGRVVLADGLGAVGPLGHVPHLQSVVRAASEHRHVVLYG